RAAAASRSPVDAPMAATVPAGSGLRGLRNQLLQLARLEHLVHDVRAADELAADVQLRDRGPVRIVLDRLANLVVLEDVDGDQVLDAATLQDLDGAAREPALRKLRGALHEEDHGVV